MTSTTETSSVGKTIATEPTQMRSRGRTSAIVAALGLSLFLAALDTVIITTALPDIAEIFHISNAGYAWVGSAYLLTNAASVPFWGKLSDVFGRKPILLTANTVFLAGSLISALAVNLRMLIAGRAVQGLGGGGIVILVNICVSDLFSIRERGFYYGVVGCVWALATALGPVLGGIFTERLNWRWCFWINCEVPTDGAAAILLLLFLDVHNPRTSLLDGLRTIDWLGSVTVASATVLLLLGLQFGGVQYAWNSAVVVCLIISGMLTFVLFFVTQFKFSPSPIMPFSIFGHISNLSALTVCFCDAFVFNSVAYFIPLYFQTVLNASPLHAGIWMLSLAIPLALFSACAGWIMEKTGRFLELLRGGLLLMAVGLGLCISFPDYISWPRIIVFLMIIGVGFGPNFHAPLIALQSNLEPNDVGAGTTTFGFIRMIAGAFGLVLGQVIFQGQMKGHVGALIVAGVPFNKIGEITKGSSLMRGNSDEDAYPAVRRAKAESLSRMWILYTVIAALGLAASFGISRKKLSRDHEEFRPGLDISTKRGDTEGSLTEKGQNDGDKV